jgi:predicted AlkP superfamily pyrophosphatase or phosphodiesterase
VPARAFLTGMRGVWLAAAVAGCLACASVAGSPGFGVPSIGGETASAAVESPPRVYVLVLDGLRPEEVTAPLMPTVASLRAQGTWYEQARAVFPAETLPNHVAMMTGQLPEDNGVIANQY